MRYAFGGFVRTVAVAPRKDAGGPAVPLETLCEWLAARGFTAQFREPTGAIYGNGRIPVADAARHDTEVNAHAVDGEVSSVRLRFALASDAPARLARWESFVHQLCGTFGLRIGGRDDQLVGPEEFLGLVWDADNWRFFATEYGWASLHHSEAEAEPGAAPDPA